MASRSLKLQMAEQDRRFYRGRAMGEDAVLCLISESLRHGNFKVGRRSARPGYIEPDHKRGGRPVIV